MLDGSLFPCALWAVELLVHVLSDFVLCPCCFQHGEHLGNRKVAHVDMQLHHSVPLLHAECWSCCFDGRRGLKGCLPLIEVKSSSPPSGYSSSKISLFSIPEKIIVP